MHSSEFMKLEFEYCTSNSLFQKILAWTQTIQTWLIMKFRWSLNTKNRVSLKFLNCSFYKVGTSILWCKKYKALLSYLYCLKCWTKGMKIKTLIGLLTWLCLTFSMSVCRFKPNGQQLTAVRNVQIGKMFIKIIGFNFSFGG